jgi:5-methyltetrahydrofolate--homocysteine methyltransferase
VRAEEQALLAANRYTDYLYFHGLAVETTEALAELVHQRVRRLWGIAGQDAPDMAGLFRQQYQGARYSFGYPACPNLEDQRQLCALLQPERIGVGLSEECMLVPEVSTSALVVHHPEARYFGVGEEG